jgi:hypothetical protein
MTSPLLVLSAVAAGIACMALALWLWRRGEPRAAPPSEDKSRQDPQDQLGTVVIPKEDLFSNQTVFLSPEAAARAAESESTAPEAATELVPREEIFRVANSVRASEELGSKAAPAGTEFIPRDELMALIQASRGKQDEPPPQPEPALHVPAYTPPPVPTPAPPSAPDVPVATLSEHFDAAVGAFARIHPRSESLDVLVGEPLAKWLAARELLALASERAATDLLLPTLDDAHAAEDRRTAAALLLLLLRDFDGVSALLERAASPSTEQITRTIITAVEHWDSPRVEALLGKALARASEADKPRWWQVFWRRALDPGSELVLELLESKDPARVKIGLELLCVHAGRATYGAAVDRHTFSTNSEVKIAAIRAGLMLGRPSALVVCKQAARDPLCPEACMLHAVLADEKELAALVEWGTRAGAPAHAAWALGYSGRRAGIEACLALLQGSTEDVAYEALAGFRAATGFSGERGEAAAWWTQNQARFPAQTRYLRGRAANLETTKLAFRGADARLWESLRIELLVRSKGDVLLPTVGMPDQLSISVDAVPIGLA